MTDEFSGIERLLGLKQGSTKKIDPNDVGKVTKVLTTAVSKKTNQLEKDLKKVDTLTTKMSTADLVKCGMSIESLEADKVTIRNEAFEVYRICKTLLGKYMEDVEEQIDTNDRMYTAGFNGVTAATNSLEKLSNMIMRFKQEEEIKGLNVVENNESGTKEMSTEAWMKFVDGVKGDTESPNEIKAEVIDEDEEEDDISDEPYEPEEDVNDR